MGRNNCWGTQLIIENAGMEESDVSLMWKICGGNPTPPRSYNPELPEELEVLTEDERAAAALSAAPMSAPIDGVHANTSPGAGEAMPKSPTTPSTQP